MSTTEFTIDEFAIADGIVTQISEFMPTVNDSKTDRTVKAERGYHFVEGTQVPAKEISVIVYPMAIRKEDRGSSKLVVGTFYATIKAQVSKAKNDRPVIDAFIKYRKQLDKHLERRAICGAKNLINEDDQILWFPDILHKQNHFNSLIELEYQWIEFVGNQTK
jgi:hypothetical protein